MPVFGEDILAPQGRMILLTMKKVRLSLSYLSALQPKGYTGKRIKNMETLIVILIVAIALFYVIKTFFKKAKGADPCDCGCSSCSTSIECSDQQEK